MNYYGVNLDDDVTLDENEAERCDYHERSDWNGLVHADGCACSFCTGGRFNGPPLYKKETDVDHESQDGQGVQASCGVREIRKGRGLMARDLFVKRDAHGKAMKLGPNQLFVLRMFGRHPIYPHAGAARSAWLYRVLDSLEKRGLIEHVGVRAARTYRLTDHGVYALPVERVQSPTGAINKTIRQVARIGESVRATLLRGAELQAWNEGVFAFPITDGVQAIEDRAYVRSEEIVAEMALANVGNEPSADTRLRIINLTRWLANALLAGYFSAARDAARKEIS